MQLTVFKSQLSFGMQGDDVARLQRAMQALGVHVPRGETNGDRGPVLGEGTVAALKGLQAELRLPPTGIVDETTVKAINERLASLDTAPAMVRGSVLNRDGDAARGVTVELFLQDPAGERHLGVSRVDATDGSYEISYQRPSDSDRRNGRIDLRVEVRNGRGPVETVPSGASILTDAGPLEIVDFVLSGEANPRRSELDLIVRDLTPLVGGRDFADLKEDDTRHDVSLLAVQSGYSQEQVAALVLAHTLAKGTRTPVALFYALIRNGLPANLLALQATHPRTRLQALETAVRQEMVPAEVGGRKIEEFLSELTSSPASRLQGMFGRILNANELETFVDQYLESGDDPPAFWERIAADPVLASRAPRLKLAAQVHGLTGHLPLDEVLLARPDVGDASDLTRLTEENWKSLIQTQGVGVPSGTPGANDGERATHYARQIVREVESAFPTLFLARRLGPTPIGTFLESARSFDLRTTYLDQFLKKNPDAAQRLTPQDREELRAMQRLSRLTTAARETAGGKSSAEEITALARQGVHSASQIAQMDREVFSRQTREILPEARANEIHERARRTQAIALALWGEHSAGLNRTGLQAVPKLDTAKQASEAGNDTAQNGIPNWETLFGGFDLCACQECSSVHGPAAYFVDILHFLDERKVDEGSERTVNDVLFDRRPDLGDIELSCDNTNTVLPLIDLVNEVLENAVSPPPPFSPFTLAPALEAALGETIATPELAAAFNPPLRSGSAVETLEPGQLWRIRDEPFGYSVVKQNDVLEVVARSRQTTGSSQERRATPQYRNGAAYDELRQTVYPWNLPFDLATAEANLFLTHLGVARRDLIEALRPLPDPFDPTSPIIVRLASERLGLTDTERSIITGATPGDFWDGASVTDLGTVQELLDRSGLSYAELEALIATWFVNPARTVVVSAKPGEPVATCDPEKLAINGLTEEVLSRLHRFVRLWRKTGYTIQELDQSIRAFTPDSAPPALTDEILVRLDHLGAVRSRLRLSIAQTLSLWKPIDTSGPGSLYARLFYNPAVFKPQDEAFRLRSDELELVHSDELLTAHAAALQAVFRVDSVAFTLLAARTNGNLTLANLSLLHRHAVLARQIGVSVQDLLTATELTGMDPFRADRSQDTLLFVDVVSAIRKSGFDFPLLDYLIRHRVNRALAFVPAEAGLTLTLTDLRAELLRISAETDLEQNKLRESAVIDRISVALPIPADVTGALLPQVLHGGQNALQRLMVLSAVDLPLSRDNARPQFETLEKLLKIATIFNTLKLPGSQLPWLFRETAGWLAAAPDPPPSPVAFASWFPLVQFQQIRRDLGLEDAAVEAILGAMTVVAVAQDDASRLSAKRTFVNALTRWLGWPEGDLQTLVGKTDDLADSGLLNARISDDYRVDLIVRLQRTMSLLKRLGVRADEASAWCEDKVTDIDARAIHRAAKARHDDAAWLKIATPLQDSLRDSQRAALVSWLVARPAVWKNDGANDLGKTDANDLYAHFLIDVEMTSCQQTSRIIQASGAVQLFAQRCLMGLELEVRTTDGKWVQWEWMKNFRVWEANRKIWLYPENWIEPDLRDDKSPFFKDLENELLQTDLDDAAAERALRNYLEKLDEVANLQIVGAYEDDRDQTLHVFGRTHHTPRVHYYRRRDSTKTWRPWEKVEVDIEGDHLIPVLWNQVLVVLWVIFDEKAEEKEVEMPPPREKLKSANRYWEIQLAWSEYRDGKWSGKNVSDPVPLRAYTGEDKILFGPFVRDTTNMVAMARAINTGNGSQTDFGGNGGTTVPDPVSPAPEKTLRPVSKEQIRFQAFVDGDLLKVRGYLRRDYRAAPGAGDSQIGCVFGEFRFSGCRRIMTTAHHLKIARPDFALAPTGTKFDHMGFTQTDSGLDMFDGAFRTAPAFDVATHGAISGGNEFASIAGNPKPTTDEKHDIPVLGRGSSLFRLMVPHQDVQFVGNRPSFYMDDHRTFMITSTGSSGTRSGPDLGLWVQGNLATTRAAALPPPDPAPLDETGITTTRSLTILAPGPRGRRTPVAMAPVRLQTEFSSQVPVTRFYTTRQYRFSSFHHPFLCAFRTTLNREGVVALLSLRTQSRQEAQSFETLYRPEAVVMKEYPDEYPRDEVEFRSGGAYELYNWELFFHIPLLIADRLRTNQRFREAQRWFHFIFDPTGVSGGDIPQRYWTFKPAHDRQAADYEAQSVKKIEEMLARGVSDELKVAVDTWRANPFNPWAVARLRTTAHQKTVVMKYIDNLIAWGDQLFRRDTLESINEATQLYVLAAEILGRRPEVIQRDLNVPARTFNSLEAAFGELSNAQIELLVRDAGDQSQAASSPPVPDPPSDTMLYFCVPENDKLLGYWATVADRLFKIRHCMNIEGQVRQLSLLAPPIDPALLVRARAAGLSISEVLSDIADVSLPNYRFSVMLQKANEMAAEVRNLGERLLSVLEKRDAEALSILRSGQELRLLQAVRDSRARQVAEAEANIEALQKSRELAQARKQYYESREFISPLETVALTLSQMAQVLTSAKTASEAVSAAGNAAPDAKIGSPTTSGVTAGGSHVGASAAAHGRMMGALADVMNINASAIGTMASYTRRQDEWDLQAQLANTELKQIDRQLAAAEIRLAIAEQELRNHDRQIDNAREVDEFLRGKFTSQDLYQFMIGRVSGLYFQSYQLAYDLAKRAERCMQHELGLAYGETSFIRFGYWESLRKGLLAGDHLAHDLKRLETAYLDGNVREYELTQHVSLVSLAPEAFLELKETGACRFDIPEWLFDLDSPGHFMRRLESVRVSIPCVTGPYTSVRCTLRLLASSYRRSSDPEPAYDRQSSDDPNDQDNRFIDGRQVMDAIVTSTGQSDAGLFEPGMRDERYLPFEGAGAISRWQLELPMAFPTFDYSTISDVILHVRYTARDGGDVLAGAARTALTERLATQPTLRRLFSLRHEFPAEWHRFIGSPASAVNALTVDLAASRFPYFVQVRTITVEEAVVTATTESGTPVQAAISPGPTPPPDLTASHWTGQGSPGMWTVGTAADPKLIKDIFVIFGYRAG